MAVIAASAKILSLLARSVVSMLDWDGVRSHVERNRRETASVGGGWTRVKDMLRGNDNGCRGVLELYALAVVVVVHVTAHLAIVRMRGRAAQVALFEMRGRAQVRVMTSMPVQRSRVSRHARRPTVVHGERLIVIGVLARGVGARTVGVVKVVVLVRAEEGRVSTRACVAVGTGGRERGTARHGMVLLVLLVLHMVRERWVRKGSGCAPFRARGERRRRVVIHVVHVVLAVQFLEERACAVGALGTEEGAAVHGGRAAGGVPETVALDRVGDRLVFHALWVVVVGVREDGVGLERLDVVDRRLYSERVVERDGVARGGRLRERGV